MEPKLQIKMFAAGDRDTLEIDINDWLNTYANDSDSCVSVLDIKYQYCIDSDRYGHYSAMIAYHTWK